MDLFVYGTLMVPKIMRAVCGYARPGLPARLWGHRRGRLAGETYPAIVPSIGHHVDGLLYRGVSPRQIRQLDRFEGPMYRRTLVRVEVDGVRFRSAVYRLAPTYYRRLQRGAWSLQGFVARDRAAFVTTYRGVHG